MLRKTLLLAVVAAVGAYAGCAAPQEATPGEPDEDFMTPERGTGVPPASGVGCAEGTPAPGGFGSTGAVREGEVGTGTGDIGSDVACPPVNETA